MKRILLLGAGRSASTLLEYLLHLVRQHGWHLTVGDVAIDHLPERLQDTFQAEAIVFDVQDREQCLAETAKADLVISMLPAAFHILVAQACLEGRSHLITASYATPDLRALDPEVRRLGLTFLMESGLDPGIDHMSAMALIKKIQGQGGELTSFHSYTGGLVAPASDTNPWHYKFTWNPRNVVVGGQGGARYLENGQPKFIPYHQLFRRTVPLQVAGLGSFDGYANRDSLPYRDLYGLEQLHTLLRGTLRRQGFCQAWHLLVQLGLTDDSFLIRDLDQLSYGQWVAAFLPAPAEPVALAERVGRYLGVPPESPELRLLAWLGLFDEELPIGLSRPATPAQVLEHLLLQKWALAPDDKDMIVMQHLFGYRQERQSRLLKFTLVVQGRDAVQTAMARTVGLPMGMAAKLLLRGAMPRTGVLIPIYPEIYTPILAELETYGIKFAEEEVSLALEA